jgi:hypothetical protein
MQIEDVSTIYFSIFYTFNDCNNDMGYMIGRHNMGQGRVILAIMKGRNLDQEKFIKTKELL